MNCFKFFVAVALIATACANPSGYSAPSSAGADYASANADQASASAGSAVPDGSYASAAAPNSYSPSSYPSSYGQQQAIPYTPQDLRGNKLTSSISYPQNKGEILIHRPAAIIVKRPPTKVLVNHPPLVVRPAPVVVHKPPAVVIRKVLVKHHPRPVKVEPVYVNVVKPPAEKYFVNEKPPISAPPASYSPLNSPSYSTDNAAAANGYRLLSGDQNFAELAGLASGASYPSPPASSYSPASAPASYGQQPYNAPQSY